MILEENYLHGIKDGDKLWCVLFNAWADVTLNATGSDLYPVLLSYECYDLPCTADGKDHHDHIVPLYTWDKCTLADLHNGNIPVNPNK